MRFLSLAVILLCGAVATAATLTNVHNPVSFKDVVDFDAAVTADTDLTVTSGARIGTGSTPTDFTALADDSLFVEGKLECDGTFRADGAITAGTDVTVTSGIRVGTGTTFDSVTALADDSLVVEGEIEVDGAAYFDGAVDMDSSLDVATTIAVGTDLTVTSGARIGTGSTADSLTALETDSLFVEGKLEVDGTARVDGALAATAGASISGAATSITATQTIAHTAGTTWNGLTVPASTATISGTDTTQITTAGGVNLVNVARPTITKASGAVTVDQGATLYIANAPLAAGTVTLTNPYSLWVDDGAVRLDGTLAVTGAQTFTGATAANGGITVDSTAFTVADTTGNVETTGTLTATGAAALNGGITVDSTAFTVADTSGNVATTGTLGVTGLATLATVAATPTAALAHTAGTVWNGLSVPAATATISGTDTTQITTAGGVNLINIARPTITKASGAVTVDQGATLYVANAPLAAGTVTLTNPYSLWVDDGASRLDGTLAVTGASTLTGAVAANGGITVDSTAFTVADTTGNVETTGTLTATGAAALNGGITVDSTAFTVADTTGSVATTGTLTVGSASAPAASAITKIVMGTVTNNPASLNAVTCRVDDVTNTGIPAGAKILIIPDQALESGLVITGAEATADKISIRICNTNDTGGAAIDGASLVHSYIAVW